MKKQVIGITAKKVLEFVKEGVMVSEIAKRLNIARQNVGVHLSHLQRDGYIKPHPCTWEITEHGEKLIREDTH